MATKTISLRLDAYRKLVSARQYPDESFSQVILRASWPGETITGKQLLDRIRERGPVLSEEQLDEIEELKGKDAPPEDKWQQDR